ncbi:hypothetical protein Droror1_Dr00023028 [Drosera rotundifolia]
MQSRSSHSLCEIPSQPPSSGRHPLPRWCRSLSPSYSAAARRESSALPFPVVPAQSQPFLSRSRPRHRFPNAPPAPTPCLWSVAISIARNCNDLRCFYLRPGRHGPVPLVDYLDIEAALLNKFPSWRNNNEPFPIFEIPFQMFAYHVMEKERIMTSFRDTFESGSEGASMSADEGASTVDDSFSSVAKKTMSVISHESMKRRLPSSIKRSVNTKSNKYTGRS